jgi:hypothetical protein
MNLDEFWDDLLSEDPPRIRKAWQELTDEEASAALEHLRRMVEEEGWHPLQKQSATKALDVIREMQD